MPPWDDKNQPPTHDRLHKKKAYTRIPRVSDLSEPQAR